MPTPHAPHRSYLPHWFVASVGALTVIFVLVVAAVGPVAVAAAVGVGLGTASAYSVLAGSTVTNTGPSVIGADLGVSPGTAITGFPPGIVSGEQHAADAVADGAKDDLATAYNNAAGQSTDVTVTADLAGQTLVPGVYTGGDLALNGQLTLDGANETNPVFIFQASSTLITGSTSSIVFINGANACDLYWQVGSSATIGTGTAFAGTVLALTSITANTGATVEGRLLARNGAVTLDTNTISAPACDDAPTETTEEPTETTEEPSPTTGGPTSTAGGPTSTAGGPTSTAGGPTPSTPAPGATATESAQPGASPTDSGSGPAGSGSSPRGSGSGSGSASGSGGDGSGSGAQDGQISPLPVGGVQTGGSPAEGADRRPLIAGVLLSLMGLGGLIVTRARRNVSRG